ncbi:unknown [Mycoplasma sp. CAG:776]|nr:unknown [Mycoplasma sp. CAG:776]
MKNIYSIFKINLSSSLVDICLAYQKLCFKNPPYIFYYTKLFKILINDNYRAIYNAMFTCSDMRFWITFPFWQLEEEDEYVLANIIHWLEDFREFVYDTKFGSNNINYSVILENWYDEMEEILFILKGKIKSFYLS